MKSTAIGMLTLVALLSAALLLIQDAPQPVWANPGRDAPARAGGIADLVITATSFNTATHAIDYVVKNVGDAPAPADHYARLWVNGEEVCLDRIEISLTPGENHTGSFDGYAWSECTNIEVRVCADDGDLVDESDETNNCLDAQRVDQAQEGTNYGFLFDESTIRWQAFEPAAASLARLDLYIRKQGDPGDLWAALKDETGQLLWETSVSGDDIENIGWVEIPVTPSIPFRLGDAYTIHVWSDAPPPTSEARYSWRGQTDSDYDRGISSVEGDWPGYDFAFRTWTAARPPCTEPPDLMVTDIWYHDSLIHYQIRNIGQGPAAAGHRTALSVDGESESSQVVDVSLDPGQRWKGTFDGKWDCSPLEDKVTLHVDDGDDIAERDEANNAREEVWRCDVTPPTIIAGPTVSETTSHSAVVAWQTNEPGDSVVRFGSRAGAFEFEDRDETLSADHTLTLQGLAPSTIYRYLVESSDATGNTVTGPEGFFETSPLPDDEPPAILSLTLGAAQGDFDAYGLAAGVSDNIGVQRVEFYLNDAFVGADYGAPPGSAYEFDLLPASLGLTREDFAQSHSLRAIVYDRSGLATPHEQDISPLLEPPDRTLIIRSPNPGHTLYVDDGVLPAGSEVTVLVYASQYEWSCQEAPRFPQAGLKDSAAHHGVTDPREPPKCSDVERPVDAVEFYVDDTLMHTSLDETFSHTYTWDASGSSPGTYEIRVQATLSDGTTATRSRAVAVVRGQPSLDVDRQVVRTGNTFRVNLAIENRGTGTAELDWIRDNLDGFQAIQESYQVIGDSSDNYSVETGYARATRRCTVEIDLFTGHGATVSLPPGESLAVQYLAVPVFHPGAMPPVGAATGLHRVEVQYRAGSNWAIQELERRSYHTAAGKLLTEAVHESREAADYQLVTNPDRLFDLNADHSAVNGLLSDMAELARLRNGILVYLSGPHASDSSWVRGWIYNLGAGMTGSDGQPDRYHANGYLLIVGETEIVPAFSFGTYLPFVEGGTVKLVEPTDRDYANMAGKVHYPELAAGRIIGDTAADLRDPVQTSIDIARGVYVFDNSAALAVSCRGRGSNGSDWINFESERNSITDRLEDAGYPVLKLHRPDEADLLWHSQDRDVIFLAGHGNVNLLALNKGVVLDAGEVSSGFSPANARPLVYASACLTGHYPDGECLGEAFLGQGAAAYIGATESSYSPANGSLSRDYFDRLRPGEAIGMSLRDAKRHRAGKWYLKSLNRHACAIYHLYGDPKLEPVPQSAPVDAAGGTASSAAATRAVRRPSSPFTVEVPGYEVTSEASVDYAEIPGGGTVLVPGKPMVPSFDIAIDHPPGQRVTDVSLVERNGLSVTTGLRLTNTVLAVAADIATGLRQAATGTEWWPDREFDWALQDNADGSSTLLLTLYPFTYNPLTTDVRFYTDFTFDVQTVSSTVSIALLTTDRDVYAQGDDVLIDLWLDNAGESQDVIVDAVVTTGESDEAVDGLTLLAVKGLGGLSTTSTQWDSAGYGAGSYAIEVEIRRTDGAVLDRAVQPFRLGVSSGEIVTFSVGPRFFERGIAVDASMVFSNTGTLPITGTAVIQVQDAAGQVAADFGQSFGGLLPGRAISFSDQWDTSKAIGDAYHAVGYVEYDAKATEPRVVALRALSGRIYLPAVLRAGEG